MNLLLPSGEGWDEGMKINYLLPHPSPLTLGIGTFRAPPYDV
jgi:hypothetical protein